MNLSDEGLQLILDGEVGGGQAYYDEHCRQPIVPDPAHTQSGVTIGIGWDCGQNTSDDLEREWSEYLDRPSIASLSRVCGLKGMTAYHALRSLGNLGIEWDTALAQFLAYTVPRYWQSTCAAFPGVEDAPRPVQEALLSLVFNRGPEMEGDRRLEMREIRSMVAETNWEGIPGKIRDMKRLWPDTRGLQIRREAEAKFIETGLESGSVGPATG